MLDVLLWLIAIEVIGLAAFPLCYYLFPMLRDRGFSVSKPFGLLLVAYLSWILSVLNVLPSRQLTVAGLVVVVGGLSGWFLWTRRQEFLDFANRERTAILVGEALFLVTFLGWVLYRAYDPAIDHTEQPMDMAFLSASIVSDLGAPQDPWLSGESVSYYYFGYWTMGVLSKLTSISSNVSYNLAMALIPALGAMGIFGLVYNMVRGEAGWLRLALVAGIVAAVLLVATANLEGVLEFMRANGMGSTAFWNWTEIKLHPTDPASEYMSGLGQSALSQSWHPDEYWWWFRATRVIDTFDGARWIDLTIQEFPFFSFMLGDLHPHVMSIPLMTLFLAVCWNFLRSPAHAWGGLSLSMLIRPREVTVRPYATVLVLGLSLGGLAFTNMWDLPVFWAVFVGIAALKSYSAGGGSFWTLMKGTVPIALVVIGLALLLFLPYYLAFATQVSGMGAVGEATTSPHHLLIVWALFLIAVTPFILSVFWQTTVREDWARLSLISLAVGFLPYVVWAFLYLEGGGTSAEVLRRLFHVLPFALLIGIATYSALWLVKEGESTTGKFFALVLSGLGLLLIMGPELLFVKDFFGTRMNTVFKLYYQAWILLVAASGFAVYYWASIRQSLSGWSRWMSTLWAGGFILLLAGSLYYPPAAAFSKGGLFDGEATLDGLAFVASSRPAEYEAIEFVKSNVEDGSTILEAVGEWSDAGLISRSTGVPTVFNWPGHELQWRGSSDPFAEREQDIATIYETLDIELARNLLAKYNVDYVYVGPRENGRYGSEGLGKFPEFMDTAFSEDGVAIYKIKDRS